MKEMENEGSQLNLELTCANGCSYRWQSQPTVSSTKGAAKRKECVGLGEWIPSIVNHLWWSAQTCEGNAEVLKEKWVSVIHHVTNRHDWPGNKHYHRCVHEPLDELTERTKLWLSPGSEAHKALVRTVKDKRLLKDLDHLTKCIHTTTLEVCVVVLNSITDVAS